MYGQYLYVAAARDARFEAALHDALAGLGVEVCAHVGGVGWHDRYQLARAWAGPEGPSYREAPTLAISRSAEGGPLFLDVRGLRSPPWNLALVRRLSHALDAWGAAVVNDRL